MRALLPLGLALPLAGALLSLVPRYIPRPGAEPLLAGTYLTVGAPLLVLGLALVGAALWRRGPARKA